MRVCFLFYPRILQYIFKIPPFLKPMYNHFTTRNSSCIKDNFPACVFVCLRSSRDSSPSSDIADDSSLPNGHAVGSMESPSTSTGALRPPRPPRPQRPPPPSPQRPNSSTGTNFTLLLQFQKCN